MSNAKVTANINDVDKRRVNTVDMVRTYLQEIGKVPLLSHEQEIVFGKQVQQMMSLYEVKENLEKNLEREVTLEEWAQKADKTPNEVKNYSSGQTGKTKKMIEANLRLVVAIAKKISKA